MDRRVVVTQSSYLPWRGWFEMAASADVLVFYDTVQFTKRDWRSRNRNRASAGGWMWLTVTDITKGRYHQAIRDTEVSDPTWWASHLATLHHTYSRFPGYAEIQESLNDCYRSLDGEPLLSTINRTTTNWLMELLGIRIEVLDAGDIPHEGNATQRLVEIARHVGANEYVTGPAARDYLDVACFDDAGIDVEFFDYDCLPPDPEGEVEGRALSVIDLLARVGPVDAAKLLPSVSRWG